MKNLDIEIKVRLSIQEQEINLLKETLAEIKFDIKHPKRKHQFLVWFFEQWDASIVSIESEAEKMPDFDFDTEENDRQI